MKSKKELEEITKKIILSKTIEDEKLAVDELSVFYSELVSTFHLGNYIERETNVKGGIALSPEHAKDCLEDYIRTARFIKGIFKGIQSAISIFKTKINVLYAGTGPLATLIIPLLPFFKSSDISIIFVDIHEESIKSVKKIIQYLGFEAYVNEFCVEDATKFKIKEGAQLHVAITETMDKALTKEPQVAITQNLTTQLLKNGILIPEKIEISTRKSFFAKEKSFGIISNKEEEYINPEKKEFLFSITKNTSYPENSYSFESDPMSIAKNIEDAPDVCIYTKIKVFDNVCINEGESLITNPYCVQSLYSFTEEKYKLIYTSNFMGEWKLKKAL